MALNRIACNKLQISRPLNSLPLQLKHANKFNVSSHCIRTPLTSSSSSMFKRGALPTIAAYTSSGAVPFEWISGIIGGSFVGGSAAMFMLFHGRIAGMSGMFGRVLQHSLSFGRDPNKLASCAQWAFMGGLIGGGFFWTTTSEQQNNRMDFYGILPEKISVQERLTYSPYIMALGGFLVGFGTSLSKGCTSGHGVVGLARHSVRSLAAVSTFMVTGSATCMLVNTYASDMYDYQSESYEKLRTKFSKWPRYIVPVVTGGLFVGAALAGRARIANESVVTLIPAMLCGFGMSTGLIVSGMNKPEWIRSALDLRIFRAQFLEEHNPTLWFVLLGALGLSLPLFPIISRTMQEPLFGKIWHVPTNTRIDKKLVLGSSLFGVGWGLCGTCPGPGLVNLGSEENGLPMSIFCGTMATGSLVGATFF